MALPYRYAQALASLPTPGVYFGPQSGWLGMPVPLLDRMQGVSPERPV